MQKKFTDGLDESNGIILSDSDEFIRSRVFTVRGVQVMLDSDLAKIYQVETRVFNQAVKRNENRFPQGFRFQLTMEEYRSLTSQIVISKNQDGETRGGRQKAPYVFTEQGITMLSGVLKSDIAVQVSIRLMNVFVAMRKTLATIAPLMSRLELLEIRQLADRSRSEENQRRNEERSIPFSRRWMAAISRRRKCFSKASITMPIHSQES